MEKNKSWIRDLIIFALELIIGIVFLIAPDTMTKGTIILLGVIAIVYGLKNVFTYCSEAPAEAASGADLVSGIAFLLIGILCTVGYSTVYSIVSGWISFIFGALMLLFGLTKLQRSIDCLRLHIWNWWINGIVALITIALAIIVLINPFDALKSIFLFIGITFIVEAVFTLASAIVIWRLQYLTDHPKATVEATVVESTDSNDSSKQ